MATLKTGAVLYLSPLNKSQFISQCLQLGMLLEVSAKKPGNVNLLSGFEGTNFEHFLASSVACFPSFVKAASQGISVKEGNLSIEKVGMGKIIQNCIGEINAWQKGGNTLLGSVVLCVPIAVAAGMTQLEENFDLIQLRLNLKKIVESTTSEDAIYLYETINDVKPGGLNRAPDLDLNSPDSKKRLIRENISLYEVFKIAADYDSICFEWVNNYPITLDVAYPFLKEQMQTRDLNTSIVHTYLRLLSAYPDTLISRKVGEKISKEISSEANRLLLLGGLDTEVGRKGLIKFDRKLRENGNKLNPGTTADLISATLGFFVLAGYRP
ncbi:MAG: triphosphoribosyl-dephospho-CoA synthase [Candidatus Bathyarchaeota archaeon]|nr:triphosphoribosyl-dephospho-CoA synthase [Candidatus Bathyarchaeota archaeon]